MLTFCNLLSQSYLLGLGLNKMYGLPFSSEIASIGLMFTAERVLGWINSYLYKKMTEKQMIRSREVMVFSSNLAIFYMMANINHKTNFIANFYEGKNEGMLFLNFITFIWRFQADISRIRRLSGIFLSSCGLMAFGVFDSLIQKNQERINIFINQIENAIQNGSTVGFYFMRSEIFLYPPQIRQEIMPLTQKEMDEIAPLRCAGLENIKEDIENDFERPDNCIICLDEFKKETLHRTLPCKHTFHAYCIDPWLLKSAGACPICKKKVKE